VRLAELELIAGIFPEGHLLLEQVRAYKQVTVQSEQKQQQLQAAGQQELAIMVQWYQAGGAYLRQVILLAGQPVEVIQGPILIFKELHLISVVFEMALSQMQLPSANL
jgi:hypothetical protein